MLTTRIKYSTLISGTQPALHFGVAIFIKFHSMTSSCFFNRGTTSSQTVTYNNNVFLPAGTKSIVQTHTFSTALVNKNTYALAQSNILHVKYAEKTDDQGLGFGV